jgi:hypothetical protein
MQSGEGKGTVECCREGTEQGNKGANRREERNVGIKERKGGRKIRVFKRM